MNIMNRTKKDIAAAVADQTGMTKKDSEAAVNAVFEVITDTLKDGGEVSIAGFGKFVVAEKPARQGINPATGEVEATDIEGQTTQVMKNLEAVLTEAGTSFENVVKTTCFLKDMGDFAAFNAVYAEYFTSKPARS